MKKLSELFDLRYGHSLELNRMKLSDSQNGIAFVSRKNRNNGVSAYVEPVEGLAPAAPGELTVALGGQGGALSTFLQERPFYTGRDVEVLTSRELLSKAALLFYCACIKENRYRYGFGRQANRTLKDIIVPGPNELPVWVEGTLAAIDLAGCDAPSVSAPTPPLNQDTWKSFRLSAIFEIKKGKRLTKANMASGLTPFVSSSDANNGVSGYVGQHPIHPGDTIA